MIAPSILSADFSKLGEEIKMVEKAGAELLHLDIMDGHFVPQITIGPPVVASINRITELPLDVHLMVTNPDNNIDAFAEAGADMISFHLETAYTPFRTISKIKEKGIKVGVALNPLTPIVSVLDALRYIDYVLLMSVSPGYGGQSFIPSVVDKIRKMRTIIDKNEYNTLIEVDGGVNSENLRQLKEAGVDIFVAGSYIFKSKDPAETVKKMKEILR